jgi:UDP-N-acetylmuramoyl-tripeptide--D-alanyl-D-alanine ligase
MTFLFILISIFWSIALSKRIFFWIYLWQLKEYHFKRFLDHFRTAKGKSIFANWVYGIKISLFILFLLPALLLTYPFLFLFLSLYFLEALKTLLGFYKKQIKLPVFTTKASAITFISFLFFFSAAIISFFFFKDLMMAFVLSLLFLDIFAFIFVSIFVFLFQPVTLLFQYRLLNRAKRKRERFKDLLVIGITGSYGKTSTKEILAFILSQKFKVLKTEKHINAEVGIAKTILEKLKPEHQIFVVEIGAYERGKITQVCEAIKPQIGIITGINQQHLATFGSQENIIQGEGFELMDNLPEDGIIVLNWDNEFIIQNANLKMQNDNSKCKIIKYAVKNKHEADIWAEEVKVEKEKLSFWVCTKEGEREFCEVNLVGGHNVYAILAGVCVAKELGISLKKVVEILKKIPPETGTVKLKKGINGINIIDASYSANPDGVISALDYLKIWEGKKVIIMPCLIELGKASKEVHKQIGEKIAQVCDLAVITTKDRFKEIKEGAQKEGIDKEKILFIENPKEIFEKIKSFCKQGDIVLLEGRVPEKLKHLLIL